MPKCTKIRRSQRRVCLGDLNTQITVQTRNIQGLKQSDVDFDEDFAGDRAIWSLVETVDGTTVFDSSNIEQVVTHSIYVRYDSTITAETWVEFGGRKFDILTVDNLDERSEFLQLLCRERGDKTKPVNFA